MKKDSWKIESKGKTNTRWTFTDPKTDKIYKTLADAFAVYYKDASDSAPKNRGKIINAITVCPVCLKAGSKPIIQENKENWRRYYKKISDDYEVFIKRVESGVSVGPRRSYIEHEIVTRIFNSMCADEESGILNNSGVVTYAKCILSVVTCESDFSKTKAFIHMYNTGPYSAWVHPSKKRKSNSTHV